jgi:riboflavin synthase alpha subunit
VAQAGDGVNLETDIIGKYVLRLLGQRAETAVEHTSERGAR